MHLSQEFVGSCIIGNPLTIFFGCNKFSPPKWKLPNLKFHNQDSSRIVTLCTHEANSLEFLKVKGNILLFVILIIVMSFIHWKLSIDVEALFVKMTLYNHVQWVDQHSSNCALYQGQDRNQTYSSSHSIWLEKWLSLYQLHWQLYHLLIWHHTWLSCLHLQKDMYLMLCGYYNHCLTTKGIYFFLELHDNLKT